jgi:hypothetical protein
MTTERTDQGYRERIEAALRKAWEQGLIYGGQPVDDEESTFGRAAEVIANELTGHWLRSTLQALADASQAELRRQFEAGRATGTVEGWADHTNAPHLVPEHEALSDGERDCAIVLKWWQDQLIAVGRRAELAEAALSGGAEERLRAALERERPMLTDEGYQTIAAFLDRQSGHRLPLSGGSVDEAPQGGSERSGG